MCIVVNKQTNKHARDEQQQRKAAMAVRSVWVTTVAAIGYCCMSDDSGGYQLLLTQNVAVSVDK